MIISRPTREEMEANWAKVNQHRPEPEAPVRPLNLDQVLDLGNTVFFTFRGRAYGVPPLAWKAGERLMVAWQEAKAIGEINDPKKAAEYYRIMRRLQRLLWAHCRAVGPFRRLCKWLRIHPNPFRHATEEELVALALFTLGRRMSTSGPSPARLAFHGPGT